MYDICCVGHITLDKVVTARSTVHMPGGTSFYFSSAIQDMQLSYCLVTALSMEDGHIVNDLRNKGTEIKTMPSAHTVFFENIYAENRDHRTQKVIQKADPFTVDQLKGIQASIYHLGPLLADDMPVELLHDLAGRGLVSLDVQGFLREVRDENVYAIDWTEKKEALKHVHILKANESEMEVITGHTDVHSAAKVLFDWGVQEVVITLGSMGSVIFAGGKFYDIPAYRPKNIVDTTGCGDTYMAGYLSQRVKGIAIQQAGEFAAAMATLKIEVSGPFAGTPEEVMHLSKDVSRKISFTGNGFKNSLKGINSTIK